MGTVVAAITTSVDGYIAGPKDGPGIGLGERGERLHYWVFGGPWSYGAEPSGEMLPEDIPRAAVAVRDVDRLPGARLRATKEAT